MKVIQGDFKKEDLPVHSGERLRFQLEQSDVLNMQTGIYTLIFDTGESIHLISNGDGAGEVLLTIEKGKMAVLASAYGMEDDE